MLQRLYIGHLAPVVNGSANVSRLAATSAMGCGPPSCGQPPAPHPLSRQAGCRPSPRPPRPAAAMSQYIQAAIALLKDDDPFLLLFGDGGIRVAARGSGPVRHRRKMKSVTVDAAVAS